MILVTSANGHVGSIIVKALASHGLPVRAFGSAGDEGLTQVERGVDYLTGDFFDSPTLRLAFEGVDQVFHIAPSDSPSEFAIGQTMTELAAGVQDPAVCLLLCDPSVHRPPAASHEAPGGAISGRLRRPIYDPATHDFLQTVGIEKAVQEGS
jgi:uncharacterized protein YbjT (DUF2867 family)